jgi:hypothetical protein
VRNKQTSHPLNTCGDGVPSVQTTIAYPLPQGLFLTKATAAGVSGAKPGQIVDMALFQKCTSLWDKLFTHQDLTVEEDNLAEWIESSTRIQIEQSTYMEIGKLGLKGGDSGSPLFKEINGKRYLCIHIQEK